MDTLTPYYGEFFVSPCPLELGGTRCSHNCPYCFANLNNPHRKLDFEKTVRLIKDRHNRKSLTAQLLSLGYPVLISNKVDPFSQSNYRQMLPIMRLLTDENIPISIQTRGGKGIDETLSFLPPSVWYISITHDTDETRKIIERQAPDIESRFELIKTLKQHNHRVVVGANPLHPDWIKDPETFFARLSEYGVEGVWLELLHLSYQQRDAMAPLERSALGEDLIKKAMKRNRLPQWAEFFDRCRVLINANGMECYSIGQSHHSDFFKPWRETYPKTFPIMQDWVNHCHQTMAETGTFTFADWEQNFAPQLPKVDSSQMYHYIEFGSQRRQTAITIPKIRTYNELLPLCWQHKSFPRANPIGCDAFGYLATGENAIITDANGLPTFGFLAKGTNALYLVVQD